MRVVVMMTVALALATTAGPARAVVTIGCECDPTGPTFTLTVDVFNQFVEGEVSGYEIILEETWVGSCEPPALLDLPALPLPPFLREARFVRTVPAAALAQKFLYVPRLKQPDGTIVKIPLRYGDVLAIGIAECFTAVAARGYLRIAGDGTFRLEPCPDDCGTWLCYEMIDLSAVDETSWQPYVGTTMAVDIEGDRHLAPMPGDPCLLATAVRPTPFNDCATVPRAPCTWSGLKAAYR